MITQIRISAKNLGELALPNFCPRCFWLKLRLNNKLPFQIFPGIFSSIDSYTKTIVHSWFDAHQCCPVWLQGIGELTGYVNPPHFSKFNITDPETDVLLTGTPDGIFVKSDGGYVIADYKTARFTEAQDSLLPMYRVQLNSYALIGEQRGIKPVTDLVLIYMEPVTGHEVLDESLHYRHDGFLMGFKANIPKLGIDTLSIRPLLDLVREIYELKSPPDGRSECPNCAILKDIVSVLNANSV